MNNNFIYARYQNDPGICKVGQTTDIISRGSTYMTGEYKKCKFIKIWDMYDEPCDIIEELIKENFSYLHSYMDSGTEYYKIEICDLIDKYFKEHNINYKNVNIEDVDRKIYDRKEQINRDKKNKYNIWKQKNQKLIRNINPYNYQDEDLKKALLYFKDKDVGNLLWSCGLGKTYMSLFIWHGLDFKNLLICVPSIYLKLQFIEAIKKLFSKIDIHTNFDKYIESNEKYKILVSTYHSCHKISNDYVFDMKIGDECHHLVNIKLEDDSKHCFTRFHNIKSKKTLYMTATKKDIEKISNEDYYNWSENGSFGETISTRSVKWAIDNNKITDYKICCIKNDAYEIKDILSTNEIYGNESKSNIEELLLSAFCALKTIANGDVTHILIYANSCDSASIIRQLINRLLDSNLFNIDKNDIYNNELDSSKDVNMKEEIEKFKNKKYGIISCVYIFGEGFDLPKLNGVVIGEKMTSDIRIVQSCLRPNRLDSADPNKISYIIIPYNPKYNEDQDKLQNVIRKMGESDECIEQKIDLLTINSSSSLNEYDYFKSRIDLVENKDELDKLKLKLYTRECFNTKPKWIKIYNRHKEYNKGRFVSVKDYKSNPLKHIDEKPRFPIDIWNGWYDYLGIDCKEFIKSKIEWINYCKSKNISSVEEYEKICFYDPKLCIEPGYFYKDFKGIINELESENEEYLFT